MLTTRLNRLRMLFLKNHTDKTETRMNILLSHDKFCGMDSSGWGLGSLAGCSDNGGGYWTTWFRQSGKMFDSPARSLAVYTEILSGLCGPEQRSRYSDLLGAGWSGYRITVRARFSVLVQTGPGAYPASCTMGTGSLSWGQNRLGVALTTHSHIALRLKNE